MKYYHGLIKGIKKNQIFVFGSNPEGRHGFGSALQAKKFYGAEYGNGRGLQGRCYALPTKNLTLNYFEKSTNILYRKEGYKSLSKTMIVENIKDLYIVANSMKENEFLIAYQNEGNNLNGFSNEEIFEMFLLAGEIPENITFSITFKEMYEKKIKMLNLIKEDFKKYIINELELLKKDFKASEYEKNLNLKYLNELNIQINTMQDINIELN